MTNARWLMPATTCKPDGGPRHVGIEIELQGIPVDRLVTLVRDALGGTVRKVSRSEYEVDVPDQGRWRVEVDFALLKEMAKEEADVNPGDEKSSQVLALDALDAVSSLLVPCEIVSPPLPMETIGEPMDAVVDAVRNAGGNGTRASLVYAFGVHFNVEPTDMQAHTVLAYMQAFVCLFDWIVWKGEIDVARRVTPYINPFPREYHALILAADYQPDFAGLIDDYLACNATRNRALDMLPLFSTIDEKAIKDVVDDDRVKARPAFHYRLANSCVDEPGWSIADPWSHWLKIEQLAADENALARLRAEMLADSERMLHPLDNQWREKVQLWVDQS
jgi:hypothetical protein